MMDAFLDKLESRTFKKIYFKKELTIIRKVAFPNANILISVSYQLIYNPLERKIHFLVFTLDLSSYF